MDKYDDYASMAWEAIVKKINELLENGQKQQSIADKLGVNKSTISTWARGLKKSKNATFADMLRYLDQLNIDPYPFSPWKNKKPVDCSEYQKEIITLHQALADEKIKCAKAEARAETYKEAFESAISLTKEKEPLSKKKLPINQDVG